MVLGGVSIVQEFLNIWNDLRKPYGDNYSKMSADSYKLEAVHADKNDGATKEKKDVRPYMGNASKRRLGEFTMVSQPIRFILVVWFVFHFWSERVACASGAN